MVARDEDFGAALTLAQESDGTWSPSEAVPSREPRDWLPRFEQERARADRERADAAEARLSKAAVESAKRPKVVSPSGQVSRLQKENARLSREAARLDKRLALESQASESHKETIRSQNREIIRLVAELRRLRDQKDTVKRLSEEAYRLRFALDVSEAAQGRLKARLLRATEAVRSKSLLRDTAELRASFKTITAPEDNDQVAEQGERPAAQDGAEVGDPQGSAGGPACQTSRNREDAVRHRRRSAQGPFKIAAPEDDDQVAEQGECPAAQGGAEVGDPHGGAGVSACQAPRDRDDPVEGALRAPERAAREAALRAQTRPAARCCRPWTHPTAHDRGKDGRAQPVAAPGLHLRIVAAGGVGAPGAAPVRQYALRDQCVGARAL